MIKINIDKAKEIKKIRLRWERKPLLEQLDVEQLRNLSNPDKLTEVESKKQYLRDITKLVDNINDLEELKKIKCEIPDTSNTTNVDNNTTSN